jgi:hypothetical protein
MDMLARPDLGDSLTDRTPIPHYLPSCRDLEQRDLVTRRNRLKRSNFPASRNHRLPNRKGNPRDGDIIGRVQLDRRRFRRNCGQNVQKAHAPTIEEICLRLAHAPLNHIFSASKLTGKMGTDSFFANGFP